MIVGELPQCNAKVPAAVYTFSEVTPAVRWSFSAVRVPNNDTYSGQYIWSAIEGAGNQYHNNIGPSIAAYCWRRTA